MSKVRVKASVLNGTISMPPSKSAAHRAIICAALAKGESVISPVEFSNDIKATAECMKRLGAKIHLDRDILTVDGTDIFKNKEIMLDCGESGSTLRFLVPICGAGNVSAELVGHGKLPERPIGIYLECLPKRGMKCITKGGLPLRVSGQLESGIYEIAGNISSQFITGLLMALPLLEGDSEIILTTGLQSSGYIDMTIDIMHQFGVEAEPTKTGWKIAGGQSYRAGNFHVEGDWSQVAFFMTSAALGGKVTIDNLNTGSCQGDKACMEVYRQFGAKITENADGITIEHNKLRGIDIDVTNIPDMVPALAVTAALAEGITVIRGAERLRIKECDRLSAMTDGLTRLGAKVTETKDGLVITGVDKLHGAEAEGYNDHRIVMSLTAASACTEGDIVITDMESINKSYPKFFEDYRKLGGIADVDMGE